MFLFNRFFSKLYRRNSAVPSVVLNRGLQSNVKVDSSIKKKNGDQSYLFHPLPVNYNDLNDNVGEDLTGPLTKSDVTNVLNKFQNSAVIYNLSIENGLKDQLHKQAMTDFKKLCTKSPVLPRDLHVILYDIIKGHLHIADLFPYFLHHAKQMFPHIDCMEDLKKVGDLRTPANWYPMARLMKRKIIFHSGPTNSGKTYHAMQSFMKAKSGIYCGPLKLLAFEIFHKCKKSGIHCDLLTGEEQIYAKSEQIPARHVSCTIEMANLNTQYDVAVIDEVQMLSNSSRGWAWTRALLGLAAKEIHLCGEPGTLKLLQDLFQSTDEDLKVVHYKRLTNLIIERTAVNHISNIQKGDCIVCFNKNDVYTITKTLEESGKEVAVIYGSLPPKTKLAQANKFNDPNHPCKVMVATDAIGMGLNLDIRRIIFYSLMKFSYQKKKELISTSSALQIAGRAGRFNTKWETGYVTTFKNSDLSTLHKLLNEKPEPITKAGLSPTPNQIEQYFYHLPEAELSNLIDIFMELCTMDDSLYFMCNANDFKYLAHLLKGVNLPLTVHYLFCCAPVNKKAPQLCDIFRKFAVQYSKNEKITFAWLAQEIKIPLRSLNTLSELKYLEGVFDILDVYLWLSFRFPDMFPDQHIVQIVQTKIDTIIQLGIVQLTRLLQNDKEKKLDQQEVSIYIFRKGELTTRLLKEGILTQSMIDKLIKEWMKNKQCYIIK